MIDVDQINTSRNKNATNEYDNSNHSHDLSANEDEFDDQTIE